jgi:hypothetical protein
MSLWLSVLALSTWVGGTLYQMLVVVPLWSASPPESVHAFFRGTDYNRTVFNFFGPPFMLARNVPLVAALINRMGSAASPPHTARGGDVFSRVRRRVDLWLRVPDQRDPV